MERQESFRSLYWLVGSGPILATTILVANKISLSFS